MDKREADALMDALARSLAVWAGQMTQAQWEEEKRLFFEVKKLPNERLAVVWCERKANEMRRAVGGQA
jgi:hypothetical protein